MNRQFYWPYRISFLSSRWTLRAIADADEMASPGRSGIGPPDVHTFPPPSIRIPAPT